MTALAEVAPGLRLLDQLKPLSQSFPGHPGVWLWTGDDGRPLVVKYAGPGDREAREMLRREAGALAALAPTAVVPELRLRFEEDGELAGFAVPYVASSPALSLASPLAISSFAAALAAFHAHSWRLPHPPFGLEVALALGGHTLWIGGAEILSGMCEALRGGPCDAVARQAREALELLATARPAMAKRFAPEDMVLVHGDVAGGNLLFHRDGLILSCLLIDLGEVVVAPPQYDLARYAVGAKLAAGEEDLLLSVYGGHWHRLTGSPLAADFRAGFEILKPFAIFDTQVAPYVIYAASGLPVDPPQAEAKAACGLAAIRSALTAGQEKTMKSIVASPSAPAAVQSPDVPALADCHFYHSIDLPVYGFQPGLWDLRHNVDAYFGHVDVSGQRVLEVGTANGFLCFELEKRGAEVVAYDLSPEHNWDIVPYGGSVDPEIQQDRRRHIGRLNNAWRLTHHLLGSRARLLHGTAYTISEEIGPFDVATFGSILLHLRDPFLALQKAAAVTTGTMIVTELVPGFFDARRNEFLPPLTNDPEAIADAVIPPLTFHPDPDRQSPWETWWFLSPRLISRFLRVLGFPTTRVTFHTQRYVDRDVWLYTVVGRRG